MGYTLRFRGAVPRPLPTKSYDLNGDRVKDVMPEPEDFTRLRTYGALQNGRTTIPLTQAPRKLLKGTQHPLFRDVAHYLMCTDPAARFYPPNIKSLLSFSTGMRVAILQLDGKVYYPRSITGFVAGMKLEREQFLPITNSHEQVLVQAIEADGEKVHHQALLQDLVWVTSMGERVNPDWVLAAPPKIPQTAAEKLLKPLFEEVKEFGTVPDPKVRLQKIDAAIEKWASIDEDPERTQQLMTPPMRDALRRALGLLSGLVPKEL